MTHFCLTFDNHMLLCLQPLAARSTCITFDVTGPSTFHRPARAFHLIVLCHRFAMANLGERLQCCYLAVRDFLEPVEAAPLSCTCAAARFIVVSAWRQEMVDFWNLDCFGDEDLDEGDENSLGN